MVQQWQVHKTFILRWDME